MNHFWYRLRPHLSKERDFAEGGQSLITTLTLKWYITGLGFKATWIRRRP